MDTKLDKIETNTKEVPTITLDEVKKALRDMKNNNAPGPGDLPIKLIKHTTTEILRHYL